MKESHREADQPRRGVSNELIGMLAIGVTLAGLTLATWSDVRAQIRQQGSELRSELRSEIRELRMAIGRLDDRLRAVEIRLGSTDMTAPGDGPSSDGAKGV